MFFVLAFHNLESRFLRGFSFFSVHITQLLQVKYNICNTLNKYIIELVLLLTV